MLNTFSLRGLAMPHDEVALHLPVHSGQAQVWLIRRLADRTLVAIHPAGCDLCAADLVTAAIEWPDIVLGRPEMVAVLPRQQADGRLVRSQIRLADDSLGGLLGGQALSCTREWDHMVRASGS
jgi:hypothetical protein